MDTTVFVLYSKKSLSGVSLQTLKDKGFIYIWTEKLTSFSPLIRS